MHTMLYSVVEAIVLAGGIAVAGEADYFTYWGIFSLIIGDLFELVLEPTSPLRSRFACYQMCVSVLIATAVTVMSAAKCEVFSDTLDSIGMFRFGVGNFIVHYYPCVRALMVYVATKNVGAPRFDGVAVYLVYCTFYEPGILYECPYHKMWPVIIGTAYIGVVDIVLTIVKRRYFQRVPDQLK
jgi:hypothetical protein